MIVNLGGNSMLARHESSFGKIFRCHVATLTLHRLSANVLVVIEHCQSYSSVVRGRVKIKPFRSVFVDERVQVL